MTYDELLAKVRINSLIKPNALVAVIKLHEPFDGNCQTCYGWQYPCPTIEAIKKYA